MKKPKKKSNNLGEKEVVETRGQGNDKIEETDQELFPEPTGILVTI